MEFIETSAKTDNKVNEAFLNMTTGMIREVNKKPIISSNVAGILNYNIR
jgi:hypothetical protein